MEPDHLAKRYRIKRSINSRSRREAPYVIYPEILCIVDYDGYRWESAGEYRHWEASIYGRNCYFSRANIPQIRIDIYNLSWRA